MPLFLESVDTLVQTRSSSRIKQKRQPKADARSSHVQRRLSTELSTRAFVPKEHVARECQTSDDLIEIVHQSLQTRPVTKSDKSSYTDFLDQPLRENSTQTKSKEEQDTQTTDLNCPHDSQVYLYQTKSSQCQCDGLTSILAETQQHQPFSISPPMKNQLLTDHSQSSKYSSPYIDLSLNNNTHHDRLDLFQSLVRVEEQPNGGASLIRAYYNEFVRLSNENANLFVNYFFNRVYGELNQRARYSIGVLHDGARYLPDLVDYFSLTYPKMIVKTSNILNSKEVLTTTMGEYRNRLVQTYSHGTFRYGPLMSISLVGRVTGKEECGKRDIDCDDQSVVSLSRSAQLLTEVKTKQSKGQREKGQKEDTKRSGHLPFFRLDIENSRSGETPRLNIVEGSLMISR